MVERLKDKIDRTFNIILLILLILFSIFMIYQILRKLFSGSWEVESLVLALLVLIIGFLFSQAKTLGRVESEIMNIKRSFFKLVADFKEHVTKKKH